MAKASKQRGMLVAVDSNVLMRLADPNSDSANRAKGILQKKLPTVKFGVPPTVVQELAHLAENGDEIQRTLAGDALDNMLAWGFQPFDLVAVGHGITETIVFKILAAGLLPEEEINDAFVIAESALAGFDLLWTDDLHLLSTADADPKALSDLLATQHTSPVQIISTASILKRPR